MFEMTREDVIAALAALGARLEAQGVHGEIFIVGGAAMALAYSDRRLTKDIDAVFEPKVVVYEAAAQVGRELGLPEGWLNDAVKGFLPADISGAHSLPAVPGLEVHVASAPYLLAMKLMAMRFGEDEEDIAILLGECGITSAQEAANVLERMYPRLELPPKTWFFLQEYFGAEEG